MHRPYYNNICRGRVLSKNEGVGFLFLEIILLGVIIGWLFQGRFKNLEHLSLKGFAFAILAFSMQALLWIDFFTIKVLIPVKPFVHILSFLPLLVFVYLNRKHRGMLLIGVGILLNLLVITANSGYMPVDYTKLSATVQEEFLSGEESPIHIPISEKTRLLYLSDIVRVPYKKNRVISIGDILLAGGLLILIHRGMTAKPPEPE